MDEFVDYALADRHYKATPEAVAFIRADHLEDGVAEITAKMREYMPLMSDIQLEVWQDPDCDCEPELSLRALFPATVDEDTAYDELDRFDDAWWLENSERWDFRIEVRIGWLD